MLKSLNHHAPRIADLCEDGRYIYIIMDYIEGNAVRGNKSRGKIREPPYRLGKTVIDV